MIKLLTSQLPDWARPNHPILQYELANLRQVDSRSARILQIFIITLLLGLGGYLYATITYVSPTKGNLTDILWRTVYFPSLLVQIVTAILALSMGIRSVEQERIKQTWDNLRATEVGAELTIRTRWIAILYRLRALILAILLVRLGLVAGLMFDMSAYSGRYLDMLTRGIVPTIPHESFGPVIIAIMITMSLLLPLTMIGASAGLGILISVLIKNRAYSATLQITLICVQALIVFGLLLAVSQVLTDQLELSNDMLFALFMGYSGIGDWGLAFLHLGAAGEIWTIVPYGIFISIGLILLMLAQSALTDGMLTLAVRLSESRE